MVPLQEFYPAEGYHQNYAKQHPDNPYIMLNDAPKVADLRRELPDLYDEVRAVLSSQFSAGWQWYFLRTEKEIRDGGTMFEPGGGREDGNSVGLANVGRRVFLAGAGAALGGACCGGGGSRCVIAVR